MKSAGFTEINDDSAEQFSARTKAVCDTHEDN
jgi:hypothetical protein